MSASSYDQIAAVYATDMGASMRFDDIGYYRSLCERAGGRALELGCGTGRILLPLRAAGIDIEGLDRSAAMLDELHAAAQSRQLAVRTHRGDIDQMPDLGPFRIVLAPYSLVTYLTDAETLRRTLAAIRAQLEPGGDCVIDAFMPRDVAPFDDFREDYCRVHGHGFLRREKRIARIGDCNRIERRYTLLDAARNPERQWNTVDLIRPWQPGELAAALRDAGFDLVGCDHDYGQGAPPHQFATHRARRP